MSSYLSSIDDDEESVVSVGNRMLAGASYSHSHPAYQRVADMVTVEVGNLSQRDAAKKVTSPPALLTVVLDSVQHDALTKMYPEFRVLNYAVDRPGHAYFVATQLLANDLLLHSAAQISSTVTHLGGSLLSSILRAGLDVHLEMDASTASAVHARMRDTRNTARVMSNDEMLVGDVGSAIPRSNYSRYLQRASYQACVKSSHCTHVSEVFCADLSTYSMSPMQFAAAMRQCKASVGYGFFIYHPIMLVSTAGEIPDTGIFFEKTKYQVRFKYPDGVAGVESYAMSEWASWLAETVVVVGQGDRAESYHMQLNRARGCFMFFQMTKVEAHSTSETRFRHVLDLPSVEPTTVVSSWVLKNLATDPDRPDSWEKSVFTVPTRVVTKLYSFGMQLTPENFSRYALRKQLKVLQRVTIEGTLVVIEPLMLKAHVDVFITALHARLFVERYESGMLTKHMMERLKRVAGFGSVGFYTRVRAVAAWGLMHLWDNTFGAVGDVFTRMCDWLESKFGGPKSQLPDFKIAPEYIAIDTLADAWRQARSTGYQRAVDALRRFDVVGNAAKLKGGPLTIALGKVTPSLYSYESAVSGAQELTDVYHRTEVETVELQDVGSSVRPRMDERQTEQLREALISDLRQLNEFDEPVADRHVYLTESVVRLPTATESQQPDYELDVDPVGTFNAAYEKFNPGLPDQPVWRDIASISQDDQDRTIVASWLRLPTLMDSAPKDRSYYLSKILAVNSPKRQDTHQELLSAVAARNLAAPKVSLPQDQTALVQDVWKKFLSLMCVSDAAEKLEKYKRDPVALEGDAFRDWMSKATPANVEAVRREIAEESQSLLEMPVGEYLMMLKSDVKPPLSDKPMRSRIEPQVIVYHRKALSAMYSSIFRVLVRRFLSLLRPEIHVNLLKDSVDIAGFIRANHPYGETAIKYLENDFSKYDKSQDEFTFLLEAFVFGELGMNQLLLGRWVQGHVDCSIRSATMTMALRVRYQRKSGDATTSFGNVLLNVLSVAYAYEPSSIVWAVFMGDDSIIACRAVGNADRAVLTLAEVFNLSAKMYITDAPYFASNFICIDNHNMQVILAPDPIKWIEKRSQPISSDDPQWDERFTSLADACKPYLYRMNTHPLAGMVAVRYGVPLEVAETLPPAIASVVADSKAFRGLYYEQSEVLLY